MDKRVLPPSSHLPLLLPLSQALGHVLDDLLHRDRLPSERLLGLARVNHVLLGGGSAGLAADKVGEALLEQVGVLGLGEDVEELLEGEGGYWGQEKGQPCL